jgi:hypothetical protein
LKKQYIIYNIMSSGKTVSNQQRIMRRVMQKGRGWVFAPNDFADVGDPRSIGMALTRLVRDGSIRRVGRGLYDYPRSHPVIGHTAPSPDAVVAAMARKKNIRLLPSKALAANQLGLSTQVPAQLVYHTDGAPASVQLDQLKIVFRRNTGRLMGLAGRPSGLVAQALRDIGKGRVTPHHIRTIRTNLPASDRKQLLQDLDRLPVWMRPHIQEIAGQ